MATVYYFKPESNEWDDFPKIVYTEVRVSDQQLEMKCEGVVFAVHHYRTDVVKAGSSYNGELFSTREKAEKSKERWNKSYSADENCEWRAMVEVVPVM